MVAEGALKQGSSSCPEGPGAPGLSCPAAGGTSSSKCEILLSCSWQLRCSVPTSVWPGCCFRPCCFTLGVLTAGGAVEGPGIHPGLS